MKKIKIIICVLLLVSFTVSAQEGKSLEQQIEETTIIKKGMAAPVFTVEMLDGSTVNTADLKGKVILVNFWATWCAPCRHELVRVQEDVIDRFAGKDFVFLGISRGEKPETIKAFMEKSGYAFPVGLDEDQAIFKMFATNFIPRNFLIGKDGKVVLVEVGYEPEKFDHMIEIIAGLL